MTSTTELAAAPTPARRGDRTWTVIRQLNRAGLSPAAVTLAFLQIADAPKSVNWVDRRYSDALNPLYTNR